MCAIPQLVMIPLVITLSHRLIKNSKSVVNLHNVKISCLLFPLHC